MEHSMKNYRNIIAVLLVNDDLAINEGLGTIDYLDREFDRLYDSGIILQNAKILDPDDKEDCKAVELCNEIFNV